VGQDHPNIQQDLGSALGHPKILGLLGNGEDVINILILEIPEGSEHEEFGEVVKRGEQ
jgi:hypothetical protein